MIISTATPTLYIDMRAIRDNWQALSDCVGKASCGAVIKSDAYGLDAQKIAQNLFQAGCREFFSATMGESWAILSALPSDAPITICSLGGFFSQDIPYYQKDRRILPVLNTIEQIKLWSQVHDNRASYLHIDTGMNRLGICVEDWIECRHHLDFIAPTLLTHLVDGDAENPEIAPKQCAIFHNIVGQFRHSIANSAGIFLGSQYHGDLVRPGIALYGAFVPTRGQAIQLSSCLKLCAPILQIRTLKKGETIGYNGIFRAKKKMRIATLAIGYNEGIPRILNDQTSFSPWWEQYSLPIIGRISMDSLGVDISAHPKINLDSLIYFLNHHQGLDDLAKACNTIPHEALTTLGGRVARQYLH